mgnify:CR=1 FL=1
MKRGDMTQSRQIAGLIAWLIFTFSATATALFVKTGGWYAQIEKPSWNPPSWIFGPVWTTLYIMMAIAAWLPYLAWVSFAAFLNFTIWRLNA